jgi:hypothetical protein
VAGKQAAEALKEQSGATVALQGQGQLGGGGAFQSQAQQQVVQLSRSQRLRSTDAAPARQYGVPAASQPMSRMAVVDDRRSAGEKPAAKPDVAAAAKSADMPKAAPTALGAAPVPAAEPKAGADTQAKGGAPAKDVPTASLSSTAPVQKSDQYSDQKLNEQQRVAGGEALQRTQQALSYELPPDFHEALFICRIAPAATQAAGETAKSGAAPTPSIAPASPAAKAAAPALQPRTPDPTPADSLKPAPTTTPPKGKAG